MTNIPVIAKKRHHHVWAEYLRRWGNGTNNIYYTSKTGKVAQDSVRGLVVERDFYKVTPLNDKHIHIIKMMSEKSGPQQHELHMSYLADFLKIQALEEHYRSGSPKSSELEDHLEATKSNMLENLHCGHEQDGAKVLGELAKGSMDVLDDKNKMLDFLIFFGHQFTRTKTFRTNFFNSFKGGLPTEDVLEATVKHAWWFISYMLGMNMGRSVYFSRKDDTHALLINNSKVPFITSDQPIVNVLSLEIGPPRVPCEQADLYYPISPTVAYVICNSTRFKAGCNEIDANTASQLNRKLASMSRINLFGDSVEAIAPYKGLVGCGYPVVQRDSS